MVDTSLDRTSSSRAPEDLKAGGFIPQRQRGKVTVRCKAPGGRLTAERLEAIARVARKYGDGTVKLSIRMSPEILHIDMKDLEAVARELAEAGQEIASCGKRYRVSTGCGGCEYNPNGLTDTQRLAREATDRYFGTDMPHKFKTCFSGCPNDCVRAREMDLGFQGIVEPRWDEAACTGCSLCVRACRDGALTMDGNNRPVLDASKCTSCGDCIKACAFEAMLPGRVGHAVFVGGKHGRHPHASYPVAAFVSDEQAFAVIETVMDWYREHGKKGERLGLVLDRVGLDSLRRALKGVVGELLLTQADVSQPKWRVIYPRGLAETFPEYGDV